MQAVRTNDIRAAADAAFQQLLLDPAGLDDEDDDDDDDMLPQQPHSTQSQQEQHQKHRQQPRRSKQEHARQQQQQQEGRVSGVDAGFQAAFDELLFADDDADAAPPDNSKGNAVVLHNTRTVTEAATGRQKRKLVAHERKHNATGVKGLLDQGRVPEQQPKAEKRKKQHQQGDELLVPKVAEQKPRQAGDYQPATRFAGARVGYAFKLGPSGLGYYKDMPPVVKEQGKQKSRPIVGADFGLKVASAGKADKKQRSGRKSADAMLGADAHKASSNEAGNGGLSRFVHSVASGAKSLHAKSVSAVQGLKGKFSSGGSGLRAAGGEIVGGGIGSVESGSDDEEGLARGALHDRMGKAGRRKPLPGRLRKKLAKHKGSLSKAQK